MQRQLRDSFEALAASALSTTTQQFLALADQKIGNVHRAAAAELGTRQQALDALIAPIRDTLEKVSTTLADADRSRIHDAASLRSLLTAVGQTQQQQITDDGPQLVLPDLSKWFPQVGPS